MKPIFNLLGLKQNWTCLGYFSEMADKRVHLLDVLYQIELGSIAKWMISAYIVYKY